MRILSCQKIKRVVRKKQAYINIHCTQIFTNIHVHTIQNIPKSSQIYIPFKTYFFYTMIHLPLNSTSYLSLTFHLWFFFSRNRPNKLKNKLKQKLHKVYCMIFLLTMPLLGQRRILHCLHSYPSRHGHISLASLSPTVTEI